MKAAIFNPYWDTLGGGERYTLGVAMVLCKLGYLVEIETKDQGLLTKLKNRFGIDTQGLSLTPNINRGDGYDLCFWLSDGSVPLLRARKNLLHFQIPFIGVGGKNLVNKMKMFRVHAVICNSNFTKQYIDKEFGVNSAVVYPPVSVDEFKPLKKKNKIIYVGRFSQLKQSKNQEFLIKTFIRLNRRGLYNWKLVLAGGAEVGSDDFVDRLKKLSTGYPIEVITGPDFRTLKKEYGEAKIFWSAAGYQIDENKNPEKMEHFGITAVEAMASGCVPIVFKGGGAVEIIDNAVNGFLWKKEKELTDITQKLISDRIMMESLRQNAQEKSRDYNSDRFEKQLIGIIA